LWKEAVGVRIPIKFAVCKPVIKTRIKKKKHRDRHANFLSVKGKSKRGRLVISLSFMGNMQGLSHNAGKKYWLEMLSRRNGEGKFSFPTLRRLKWEKNIL
jgi:hypothetical protein